MNTDRTAEKQSSLDTVFIRKVLVKALILFLLINLLFAAVDLKPALGRISAYNLIFPGRLRLPYGDNPDQSYNLSVFNLEAMFASHEIDAAQKPENEFRVILIGDSSIWGYLLEPDETLSAQINSAGVSLPDGRRVRVYNLGYPVQSLTKDLLILSSAMRYQPDLILWPLTLESFPYEKQLFPPVLQHNPGPVRELIKKYSLDLNPNDPALVDTPFLERTIAGDRRSYANLIRLQLYGVMWAATGIDHSIPVNYTPTMQDLPDNIDFHQFTPPHLNRSDLALEVLNAGVELAGDTPILFINEPIFISQGENSDIRYNFMYPQWAYDDYREIMRSQSQAQGWRYLDLWNLVPGKEFTNTAVHLSPEGTAILAHEIIGALREK
jgi:hypothetical protein